MGNPKHQAQVSSPKHRCYLLLLLGEDLLLNILEWSRPDDQDQYIWLWLCRISATCKDFRRLVRLERKGVPPLMPTVFQLWVRNRYYLNKGLDQRSCRRSDPVALRVKLINTIRRSGWMGSSITCFHVHDYLALCDEEGPCVAIVEGLKALLAGPWLPKLLDLKLTVVWAAVFLDRRFSLDFAQAHSGLESLCLTKLDPYVPSPNEFAILSGSLRCLKHAAIGVMGTNGFRDEHLKACMANLNPNLESFALKSLFIDTRATSAVDEAHCPNLKALTVGSCPIVETSRLVSIIRSKRNLSCIELYCRSREVNEVNFGSELITAITETKLRLETFRTSWTLWMTDDILMQLVESPIEAFHGRVLLTTIGICGCKVSPVGLRAVLVRWRETNPDLPLTIELFHELHWPRWAGAGAGREAEDWQPLLSEFPEVSFRSIPRNNKWLWRSCSL